MPNCVVKGCRNYDTKVKKIDGISYHRFPRDPDRHKKWCRIVKKQRSDPYYKPHKNTRICSAHFSEKDFDISKSGKQRLRPAATPRIAGCNDENDDEESENESDDESSASSEAAEDETIPDFDLTCDSPKKEKLSKYKKLEQEHRASASKIKSLETQNARLRKKNESLMDIIKELTNSTFK